jgi:DNA-directed RNA polymerase specialized sigma24 family protein
MFEHEHLATLTDDPLLQNVGNGCEECLALLSHRYFRQVFAVAFRILRDRQETKDILQEVFLAIFLQRERFDPSKGCVKTWILQFAYFRSLLRATQEERQPNSIYICGRARFDGSATQRHLSNFWQADNRSWI